MRDGFGAETLLERGALRLFSLAIALVVLVPALVAGRVPPQDEFHSSGDCQRRHGAQARAINDEHIRRMRACHGDSACIRRTNAWKAEALKRIGAELRACVRQAGPPPPTSPGEQPTPEGPPTPPEEIAEPPDRRPPPSSPPGTPPESGPPSAGPPDRPSTPPTPPRAPRGRPAGGSTPPASRIAVLGDSEAVSPNTAVAFPRQLQILLQRSGRPATVTNRSRWGATSADALGMLDAALARAPQILIVAVGSNDGLQRVPVAQVRRNLTSIVRTARARRASVLLCAARTVDLVGLLGEAPGDGYEDAFNRVSADVARAQRVTLVPFLLEGIVGEPALTQDDGLHPNAAGARRIAERLLPYVEGLVAPAPAAVPSRTRR